MGDRRVADRRAPEEGVFKIHTKNLVIYCILGVILAISLICNIIFGVLYNKYKTSYDSLVGYDENMDINDIDYDDYADEETEDGENTCSLVITGDKDQIKAGETATFEIKATDINAGSGIVMFESTLDYDSNSLECNVITDDSMEWSKTALTENYITIARNDLLPSSDDQVIAKIEIKAKENIESGQQTVTLSNIKFTTDNDESFSLPNEDIVIDI